MVAAGMIRKDNKRLKKRKHHLKVLKTKTTFKGSPRPENLCIKKQTEDTSGKKAQQTNLEKKAKKKKSNKTLFLYKISRKNLSGN